MLSLRIMDVLTRLGQSMMRAKRAVGRVLHKELVFSPSFFKKMWDLEGGSEIPSVKAQFIGAGNKRLLRADDIGGSKTHNFNDDPSHPGLREQRNASLLLLTAKQAFWALKADYDRVMSNAYRGFAQEHHIRPTCGMKSSELMLPHSFIIRYAAVVIDLKTMQVLRNKVCWNSGLFKSFTMKGGNLISIETHDPVNITCASSDVVRVTEWGPLTDTSFANVCTAAMLRGRRLGTWKKWPKNTVEYLEQEAGWSLKCIT